MPWKRARCKSSDLAKKVLARQEPVPEEVERLNLLAGCWGTQSPQLARTEIWMIGDSILAYAWETAAIWVWQIQMWTEKVIHRCTCRSCIVFYSLACCRADAHQ